MVMYRLARLFLVVLLAGGVVVSAGEAALACSCAVGDPASRLAESDAAFVGRLISSAEPVPDSEGNISTADPVAWVFEVEEAVKGDLETPLTVMSPWSGASCGFEVRIGERIGVLLREDGGWRSGLCSQLDADVLLRAAVPLPTPTPDGTAAVASAVPEPVPATSSATTSAPATTVAVTSTAPATCRGMRVFPIESAPRNDPPPSSSTPNRAGPERPDSIGAESSAADPLQYSATRSGEPGQHAPSPPPPHSSVQPLSTPG